MVSPPPPEPLCLFYSDGYLEGTATRRVRSRIGRSISHIVQPFLVLNSPVHICRNTSYWHPLWKESKLKTGHNSILALERFFFFALVTFVILVYAQTNVHYEIPLKRESQDRRFFSIKLSRVQSFVDIQKPTPIIKNAEPKCAVSGLRLIVFRDLRMRVTLPAKARWFPRNR